MDRDRKNNFSLWLLTNFIEIERRINQDLRVIGRLEVADRKVWDGGHIMATIHQLLDEVLQHNPVTGARKWLDE